jgi:hypothetical protein
MKPATENKILPTKWYWISLGVVGSLAVLTFVFMRWVLATVFIPLLALIYFIGRHNQENRNPDMVR